jgi:alpha-1,6-mannosyltransferase
VRICDINNLYSPTGGGVRTYHDAKLRWFAERPAHEYALVVPGPSEADERIGAARRFEVPGLPLGRSGYRSLLRAGPLAEVLRQFRPDVVELGSVYTLPSVVHRAIVAAGLEGRVATVGYYHADYPDTYVRPVASLFGERIADLATARAERHAGEAYRRLTATFGASDHVLQKLASFGIRRLFKAPLGVDDGRFSPARRDPVRRIELGGDGRRVVVLYLARLAPEKGIDLLIEAYPAFRDPERIQLVIGGHGPWQGRVDDFVADHPEVRRLPYLRDADEVARTLASADVVVLPGRFETFSLSSLEALASGTPIVAPDAGGAGELAREFGAEVFEAGSSASLASAISRMAERTATWSRQRLRERVVARYAWNASLERMVRHYQRVHRAFVNDDLAALEAPEGGWHQD